MKSDHSSSIIFTGATGFIGRHLLERFRADGRSVISLERQESITNDVERISWSLQEPELDPALDLAGSTLLHLAAVAHRRGRDYSDSEKFESLNADSTLRLAESAAESGVRHFIFMSSIGVLGGDSGSGVFDESSRPAPASPYAHSKWLAEQMLQEFAKKCGMHITVLRPPVVYGPGAPGNFRSLQRAVRSGLPLPFGSIDNSRQLLAMGNLADAVDAVLEDGGDGYRVFHVADAEAVSTAGLCRQIADILRVPERVFRFPPAILRGVLLTLRRPSLADGLLGNLRISTTAIEAATSWRPQLTLRQGLEGALANRDDH